MAVRLPPFGNPEARPRIARAMTKWVQVPRGFAVESPCGRFVLTDGVHGFGPYSLHDQEAGKHYRSRTLADVREDVRSILNGGEDR